MRPRLRPLLTGGDRRSIARASRALAVVRAAPSRVAELAALTGDADPLVVQRALDLLEKVAHEHPDWVRPHRRVFIGPLADHERWEIRLQIVRALPLFAWKTTAERRRAIAILRENVNFPQTFVRAWALDVRPLGQQGPGGSRASHPREARTAAFGVRWSILTQGGSMRFAPGVVAFVLSAGFVVSAHAGQAPTADNTACSLLTKEDAAAALGESVTGPRASGRAGGPWTCEYGGSGLHRAHLNVIPFTPPEAGMYRAMCAQKSKDGLTGLGDTACWYNDKHEELQVLKGTMFLSIEMQRSGDPTEAIKVLMKKIYDRAK